MDILSRCYAVCSTVGAVECYLSVTTLFIWLVCALGGTLGLTAPP